MAWQNLSRRRFIKSLGAAGGAAVLESWGCSRPARRGSRPCPQIAGKKVRWIVPYAPGGGFDADSRLIVPFYGQKLGAEMIIENIAGAAGIVGAKRLKDADPNGLTQGILSAPGLLVAALTGETESPNPATDFTILGRLARTQQVWTTGGRSSFHTMDDLLAEAQQRPLLFGTVEVGSTDFVASVVSSQLLGLDAEFIAGFANSRSATLAALRGEVDVVCFNFDSILDQIEAGDLRLLMQVSTERISSHASLEGVPLLCGEEGLAARRAAELGRDVKAATAAAEDLARLVGAGRVVVAPPNLDDSVFQCLAEALHQTLTGPAFQAAAVQAHRTLDVARADVARADVEAAMTRAIKFTPIVRAAIKKVRS